MVYDIRMEDGWAVTDQLVGLGLDPLGIELVVLTHMHQDHVGAVAQLPRATFVVDRREWEAATSSGFRHGYRRQLYDHDYDWRALDFGAANVDSFASFGHVIDLFDDGSVRLLSTPGHTKGHMSVLLRLKSGRELLVTGDAAYSRATIEQELVPLFCDDVHRYQRSLREIRRYLESTPTALVVCGHDPESWPQVPERYE
jgi:glyoxylase-like metal-dependent hydrolase (beta-lactamase superfamily II)